MSPLLVFFVLCICAIAQAASSKNATGNQTETVTIRKLTSLTVLPAVIENIHEIRASELAKPKDAPTPVPAASFFRPNTASKHSDVTYDQVQSAKKLVAAAHESQAAYNIYRSNNARRNTNLSKKSAEARAAKEKRSQGAVTEPVHSQDVLDAVRMLGDIDAIARLQNGTLLKKYPDRNNTGDQYSRKDGKLSEESDLSKRADLTYWLPDMHRDSKVLGTSPFGKDSSYRVYRNVKDYGVIGDGVTDDTAAINFAISDGHRCGVNCLSSSVKPALVYFPKGTYRISSPLVMLYNTQLVGQIGESIYPEIGKQAPTLLVDPHFLGFGVITSNIYLADGISEWYIEQSNFYRQIRNFIIDLSEAQLKGINGIHWQVAQATSITSVSFVMSDKRNSTQIGIFAENGSGGWISDVSFYGGMWGILGGNQQYTVRNAWFHTCANAIGMIWDWGWTWSHLHVLNCDVGINLAAPGSSADYPVGSLYLMDSDFVTTPIVIYTYPWKTTEQANTVVTLDNVQMIGISHVFKLTNGLSSVNNVSETFNYVTIGDIQSDGTFFGNAIRYDVPTRPGVLTSTALDFVFAQNGWFTRPKPSYSGYSSNIFFNAKWYAAGDGVTDDTRSVQAMLNYCAAIANCILFFPAGTYIITSTIFIPINSYIIGEAWAQIMARGSNFADGSQPTAAVVVGRDDDAPGAIEIQDMLFTSQGNLPGLVMVVWQAKASSQGSVALWDTHFRVGGALGTGLQVSQCPTLSGGINHACVAAFAMIIITTTGYFENMWAWVADHDLDDAANLQVDVYGGRGILIQGDGPVWLWGTSSEHSTLYQYGIIGAKNVFMSMIQTESPYMQGSANTQGPAPFDQIAYTGDPSFDSCGSSTIVCNNAWALNIQNSNNIHINGAGLYSWFQNYNEECVKTADCQQKMIYIYNTADLWLNHVVTIGAVEMISPAASNDYNEIVLATAHLQAARYPWWSVVAAYLDSSDTINTTVNPSPIKHGWVAFGDSYAAGIGAGATVPDFDKARKCHKGDGGYPWTLNFELEILADDSLTFQALPCSGDVAVDITKEGGQLSQWFPGNSDIATLSIIGNDFQFGPIVTTCIVGWIEKDAPDCEAVLKSAENLITDGASKISELLYDVWQGILDKSERHQFTIYQTGYPQFFQNSDHTCDTDRFWVGKLGWYYYGEYLTPQFRARLNQLSLDVNAAIILQIKRWNAGLPRPQIVFVEPDNFVYPGHRYCENSRHEPQKGADQDQVAFFYPLGKDYVKPASSSWPATTVNSASCKSLVFEDWADTFLCDIAVKASTNSTTLAILKSNTDEGVSGWSVDDGGHVSITETSVEYLKMFHPKTYYNTKIAVGLLKALQQR